MKLNDGKTKNISDIYCCMSDGRKRKKLTRKKWEETDEEIYDKEVADICLNCPLDDCDGGEHCVRFKNEYKKIKERRKVK